MKEKQNLKSPCVEKKHSHSPENAHEKKTECVEVQFPLLGPHSITISLKLLFLMLTCWPA